MFDQNKVKIQRGINKGVLLLSCHKTDQYYLCKKFLLSFVLILPASLTKLRSIFRELTGKSGSFLKKAR